MYKGYYGTFIAHSFSLIVAIWATTKVAEGQLSSINLNIISQVLIIINSSLSLVRYGFSKGYKIRKLHVITLNAATLCQFSLLHYAINQGAKLPSFFTMTIMLNIIPFLCNISRLDYRCGWKESDYIIVLNSAIFLWNSILIENFYAVAFLLSFAFGYFYVGDSGYFLETEVPSVDIYQYIQCFLCVFTVNAFNDQNLNDII